MGRARTLSRRRAQSGASADSRDDSWQPPSLTASERAYMIRKAKEASVALVDHAHTLDGPVQWHYTGKFRGIQMYRGEGSYDHVGTTGTEFLCGVTTMMGSIEEVASHFDQQTTELMLSKKAEDVLDCGVLYSLVHGDPQNPYYRVSAKYQLYEGPSAFSRERDYCYLECQNTFRHASGRRGWVLSMHSIKLPSCPEVDGVVRGSMYQSGYVFVEAEKEGYMDVMHSLQINFKSTSRLPHFLLNSALKRRILSVVSISREIQTSRMGRQTLLRKKDLMPKRTRSLCTLCSRKFSLFVRKTRCRVCGEVVCQPCAPQVMISAKRGPIKTRVCTRCYHLSPSDEYEPVGALPSSHNGGDRRRLQNETRYSDILQDHHDHPDLYHEEDEDSMEEDGDEDGLEEQSDYSVFAQSRFTEASRDSMAASQFSASRSQFESHFEDSSQFDATSELDDSQYYDGGSSENSFVSGTSTSYWQGGNSAVSSMAGWNQASSVKPADGYIYDPQASTSSSNFYGASNYGSEYGASKYSTEEERRKRPDRYKAAPIPEDEPSSHRGYNKSPNSSYDDYKSAQGSNYNSTQVSDFKATQDFKVTKDPKPAKDLKSTGSSQGSQTSNTSTASKTLSIQSLAKARSARYGIKSQFPPPPPPPPLSPPLEEEEEEDSPLHLGELNTDNTHGSKNRKPKGIAARKMFTPPPPQREASSSRSSSNRDPKVPRNMAFNAAVANRDSRVSQTSSRDSRLTSSTRSSAILEQMRRNRGRTFQLTPESDRSSAVLKSLEEEHLNRMREIERMQAVAKEKAARRSMSSNGSRNSMRSAQNSQNGVSAAVGREPERFRRSRGAASSSTGPMPGSPPGTPPSMRGRRLPNPNSSFNSQGHRSFRGDRSRRTDASSDFGASRFLSNRSNGAFASAQSDDLMFDSQRSGKRFDSSLSSSNSSKFGGKRFDASQVSGTHMTNHPDDLAFDASHLSVDKFKFSSSIAILENPDGSPENVAIMERPSQQRSSNDSLLNEDLLDQSSAGLSDHISSMRARAAYRLPDEEDRPSDELRKRQEEHRKRMEELSKLAANHVVVEENVRDSTSTLGGLHDSSISLTQYSANRFGDSTISSASSASSVDIDDEEFDFETRPLGRTKRSGTIPFSLEELEQVPDVESDDEQSEGPDDSDTSFRLSEEHAEYATPSYRSSEESAGVEFESEPSPAYRPSEESENEVEQKRGFAAMPFRLSIESVKQEQEQKSGLATPPRQSEESVEHEHELAGSMYRPSDESVEQKSGVNTPPRRSSEHNSGFATPPRRQSEESVEMQSSGFNSSSRRTSEDLQSGFATPSRRSSVSSDEHEHEREFANSAFRMSEESVESAKHEPKSELATPTRRSSEGLKSGFMTPPRRSSSDSAERESEFANSAYRPSEESVEHELEHENGLMTPPRRSSDEHKTGLVTPPRRLSVESVEQEQERNSGFATPPRRSSEDHKSGFITPPRRQSEESGDHALASSAYRSSEESMEDKQEHSSGLATPPRRLSEDHKTGLATPPRHSEESMGHEYDNGLAAKSSYRSSEELMEHEQERSSGFATPPRRSSEDHKTGFTTPPRRQSEESVEHQQQHALANSAYRSSEESVEHKLEHSSGITTPSRRSSEDHHSGFITPPRRQSEESTHENESEDAGHRSSEEHEATKPEYRSSADSVEHKSERESDSSSDSDSDAAYRTSEEQVASEKSAPKFQPFSSQLVPGEGSAAVDEFHADSSRVISDSKLAQVDEHDDDTRSPRDTSDFIPEDHTQTPISSSSTEPSEHLASPRESNVSAIDEELMNRPTNELFELIRANRPMYDTDGSRSSDVMHDLEASHLRRMEELNRIAVDHLGNRISNLDEDMLGSAYQPGRSMHPGFRDDSEEMQWRSSSVMQEVQSKHQVDMERLRRRIRQLEEECRESIASVLTPEEMDLSEFDSDDDDDTFNGHRSFHASGSFNPQSSFMCASDLSASTISERNSDDEMDIQPLPARILFEQIAQLTQLQREMSEAEDDDDEEEYRERIKEQYRVLQTIKSNGARQERESLSRESLTRESLEEENWI
ncbi:FYVE zinc finger domain-containing protein [Phytophthora infestans]|uniref:FYVE zinc finger domain-containing protein n=1 Tax=Phytophthora infestans TaxID=4787 RepID=A0A8S9TYD8_PHYIN|nr:FYVE zinc finger domain-containing protein [Phytophthora infestans]